MEIKPQCEEGRQNPAWLSALGLVVTVIGPILLKLVERYRSRRLTPPREP